MSTINNNVALYDNLGLSRSNEAKVEETKEDQFMQLLIAQLKNQDPLEPQENGEFLSQLAQFETAAGAEELQKSFDNFSNNMLSASALQASSLVGRSVLAPGGYAQLEAGQNVTGQVDLGSSTTNLTLEVTDAAGQLVKIIPMGTQASGEVSFSWDGTDESGNYLPPGGYRIRATADVGNEKIAQEVLVSAKVDSVTVGQGVQGLKLNLAGLGSVDFSAVKEIR
ncbi:MAG: flagellar hook assembly protein FlgD [gamma proteobacterium symbiont of Bathyaustriella thionipta]|nr:flagellar hook assembly protein FlgD [gamma proteobacterium symbiont of Bathyaustriella thionipta]MCU7950222.1 flagellar hook assembly protein FlgD [gamma proteobacterium symbiont of Bathyaustriella thionipta]MCU7952081.1 flagellar hook assembly protein FlgD [gamma proteobacterium symbiont of Bathyaustriella thionipta]MCU7956751.1 flagellar hook assembly protein FlgD [gamma proteobacterium symbiont of Bathyaustriella thionipta]MCU7965972.1 flagellar hook assembly protein FlgD [gamma proteoba